MMRAAIYARFSSENQSASSIADQIVVCSRYIAKNGWTAGKTNLLYKELRRYARRSSRHCRKQAKPNRFFRRPAAGI